MCHPVDPSVVYHDSSEQQIELPGSGRSLPTFAYGYNPADRKPAVIIAHDIHGANPFYRDMGRRLAEAGFAAFLPDLFAREGELTSHSMEAVQARAGKHSFPTTLADLRAIAEKLSSEGRNVGLIGFCMGGTLALFAAVRIPAIKANVVYYGFPVNARPTQNRPDSAIDEVEQVQTPILGFFGAEDKGVGADNVRAYEAAAHKAGKTVDFTIYPALGHAFMTFDADKPSTQASQESWASALDFFHKQLG